MTYSLHPGAEHDIADALDFYSEYAGSAVAERFLEEFEHVAKLLVEHPDLGKPTASGRNILSAESFSILSRISKARKQYSNSDCAPSAQKARLCGW